MPLIPSLKKLRQEDQEFETSLVYISRLFQTSKRTENLRENLQIISKSFDFKEELKELGRKYIFSTQVWNEDATKIVARKSVGKSYF
jgi:hypothetical protein